jgi:hypothetical protein
MISPQRHKEHKEDKNISRSVSHETVDRGRLDLLLCGLEFGFPYVYFFFVFFVPLW